LGALETLVGTFRLPEFSAKSAEMAPPSTLSRCPSDPLERSIAA